MLLLVLFGGVRSIMRYNMRGGKVKGVIIHIIVWVRSQRVHYVHQGGALIIFLNCCPSRTPTATTAER